MTEITLTDDERARLEGLAASAEDPAVRRRAAVVLHAADDQPTEAIAEAVGYAPRTVQRWRRRYAEQGLALFADASGDAADAGSEAARGERDLKAPELYLNREMSLLAFQARVLEEAQDPGVPLLERVKFLAILGSNLDEFFMVRVGGLKKQLAAGVAEPSPDGLTPARQLRAVRKEALRLMRAARTVLRDEVLPGLAEEGVRVLDYAALSPDHRSRADHYFREVVFPVLTPMAFDPGHPFPHISNLSLNLAVLVRDAEGTEHFARVKVPDTLPRLVPLKGAEDRAPRRPVLTWMEQLVAAHLPLLFPGMEVVEAHPFRVTRNAEMAIQELEADDLLETMEEGIRQRRFGAVVRVEVPRGLPAPIRAILQENLNLKAQDVLLLDEPLGLSGLMQLRDRVDRTDLREAPHVPLVPPGFKRKPRDGDLFGYLSRQDRLLHHPYESFTPVVDFLEAAAVDPNVLAIKQTLYRVGRGAPVVKALLRAREYGKQVTVLVELKARFDEESNIGWAKALEREGVHVIYGLLGLKTHAKIALVVRREGGHIQRYLHLATGNYNAVTARLYEDLGLFTTDADLGMDATDLFNYLTGYSAKAHYRKLIVGPINLRRHVLGMIEREEAHQRAGRPARLILKTNALVDSEVIRALYRASQAGVEIDLIVRGICCLRPGVPGVSETIRVRSIVGRFLEHSRIYYARNGGEEQLYLGSADLMPRNLDRRVELLFPVEHPDHRRYLIDTVLATYLSDTASARLQQPDGSYVRPLPDESAIDSQAALLQHHRDQARQSTPWSPL